MVYVKQSVMVTNFVVSVLVASRYYYDIKICFVLKANIKYIKTYLESPIALFNKCKEITLDAHIYIALFSF